MTDVIELTQALIRCASVTPKDEGALTVVSNALGALGFERDFLQFGEISNLFARLGTGGPHLCYAGHTDVVPPGPVEQWTSPPFEPEIRKGVLYGRGASDMKGSVAAFTAAVAIYLEKHGTPKGSISLLITGDEEAEAVDGTAKVLEWMEAHGHIPDVALVGEPTNPDVLGQEIKIGRRGSLTGELRVLGKQGHSAYPQRADNPLPRLVAALHALENFEFDAGTEFFPATNLEIVTIDTGNTADNIIPSAATGKFNVRFNDTWSSKTLAEKIRDIVTPLAGRHEIKFRCSAESFITCPGPWTETVKQAVQDITGRMPVYATGGGTSDARFITRYCPVVECGGVNKTIHEIDESASVDDLRQLTEIYVRVLELYFF